MTEAFRETAFGCWAAAIEATTMKSSDERPSGNTDDAERRYQEIVAMLDEWEAGYRERVGRARHEAELLGTAVVPERWRHPL